MKIKTAVCFWFGAATLLPAQILKTVHPGFTLSQLRPDNFQPGIGGMDLLPDGRLVITTWLQGLLNAEANSIYLLEGLEGSDHNKIGVKKIGGGMAGGPFNEPLGIVFREKAYYVVDRSRFMKLEDTNGDEIIDRRTVVNSWKQLGWDFGPIYKDGFFYVATDVALHPTTAGWQPDQGVPDRGSFVKLGLDGSREIFADGLRVPNGIGAGPRGEFFVTDNQGAWLPACKLIHIRKGRNYGEPITTPKPAFGDQPVSPPAVWLPYNEIGRSTSQPAYMTAGPFQGQMVMGDIALGGISRVFLEEVNGEFQGAVFPMSGGLECGINRIIAAKDGSLYLGGVGNGEVNNWGWLAKKFGLQKLKPNGKVAFEMLAIRSRAGGMEVEFTKPLPVNFDRTRVQVRQFWYEPTSTYGGPKKEETQRTITSMQLSPDRKSLYLETAGLKANWVTNIRVPGVKSETGEDPLFTESWYTLNSISSSLPFTFSTTDIASRIPLREGTLRVRPIPGGGVLIYGLSGSTRLEARNSLGKLVASADIQGREEYTLPVQGLESGVMWITAEGPRHRWVKRITPL